MDFLLHFYQLVFLCDSTKDVIQARNTPQMVPISIPPAAAVPIVLLPILPGPVANTNGSKPAIKANDVIRIGRNLALAPSIAASKTDFPAACLNGKFYNQNGFT
jgi:hypothetical protein